MEEVRFNILNFAAVPSVVFAMLAAFPYLKSVEMDVVGISAMLMQFVVAIRHAGRSRYRDMTSESGFVLMLNKKDLKHPSENMVCIYSPKQSRFDRTKNVRIDTSDSETFDISKYLRITFEITDMDDETNNPT